MTHISPARRSLLSRCSSRPAAFALLFGCLTSATAAGQAADAVADHPGVYRGRFDGHTGPILCMAAGPNGLIASGSDDRTARLWDTAGDKPRLALDVGSPVHAVAFSADGTRLVTGDADRRVTVWKLADGTKIASQTGFGSPLTHVELSADGTVAAGVGRRDGRVWDVATGNERMAFNGRFALSPDGKSLAVAKPDGSIQLWEVGTAKATVHLNGHTGTVNTMQFSPDGKALASGESDPAGRGATGDEPGHDKAVKVWDLATGKLTSTLTGHVKGIGHLAFAPDGKTLVSTDYAGQMTLSDAATGHIAAVLASTKEDGRIDGTPIGQWAISPDLKLWAVGHGTEVSWLDIRDFTGQ